MDARTSFDGTSSRTLGSCLLVKADGKGIGFVPSIDEAIKPSIRLHCSGREVPCIVVVDN